MVGACQLVCPRYAALFMLAMYWLAEFQVARAVLCDTKRWRGRAATQRQAEGAGSREIGVGEPGEVGDGIVNSRAARIYLQARSRTSRSAWKFARDHWSQIQKVGQRVGSLPACGE